ncbi:MAG: glycoside hydrolase family 88 protein [Deltaproteobacteria bacterium]|nr:glycoside hydrolase family 88 protein [Deltaproteobacteria bacterium]
MRIDAFVFSCVVVWLGAGACDSSGGDPGATADAGPPCTPAPADADAAFAAQHAPSSPEIALASRIADRYIAEHPAEDLAYDWGEGVLVSALWDLARVTGSQPYRDYARRWLDHHVKLGYTVTQSDRCVPAITAALAYRERCDPSYRTIVDTTLRYLYQEALRTPEGGLNHLGTSDLLGVTLWVDSLYMFGELFIRWGETQGDDRALGAYGEQLAIMRSKLQDDVGFFRHAHNWSRTEPNVYWARGNSWVIVSGTDYLRVLAAKGRTDDGARTSLRKLADAIVASQDAKTGLWWSVVNRPGEIYLETSGSALFAAGLARGLRAGVFDAATTRPALDKALAGVKSKIVDDARGRPVVKDISGPTTAGTFADYARVKLVDDLHFGVGGVILALVEASGLP